MPAEPPPGLDLSGLRHRYDRDRLDERDVPDHWLTLFEAWFAAAAEDPGVVEVNAVQLATVSASGRPDVRTVLAKSVDADGVTLFTNYDSAKAHDLDATGVAAVVFSWLSQERQVRLRGRVARVSRQRTEDYFATRPRGSQLGAWASAQSAVVAGRAELDAALQSVTARFDGEPVPAPEDWGGYLITPNEVEFWQGRPDRLHDRVRYRIGDDGAWSVARLAP